MKKIILIIISGLIAFNSFSQQDTIAPSIISSGRTIQPKILNKEFRLNIASAIAGLPELNYEQFVEDNFGVGIALAASLEKIENMNLRTEVLPYCRLYFGKKKASGFFIEANIAIMEQKDEMYVYPDSYTKRHSLNLGFGAAIGVKLITTNNFVGEIYLGGGRLFGESINNAYPRMGVTIGRRS